MNFAKLSMFMPSFGKLYLLLYILLYIYILFLSAQMWVIRDKPDDMTDWQRGVPPVTMG